MCTVTFIPTKNAIFFTSNRDEKNWRQQALAPDIYEFSSGKVIYPKDGDAGGTWIAGHSNGNVVVFLNGAFEAHQPTPPYRKSRGLILLDLIDHSTPFNCFLAVNLNNIEPFTAIIRDNGHLFECRWDGEQKHFEELDADVPHIWSSATLYDNNIIKKRKDWFDDFIMNNPSPLLKDILHFHHFTGDGDEENDLVVNREGKVSTVSITSIDINDDRLSMEYSDLQNGQHAFEQIKFDSSMAQK